MLCFSVELLLLTRGLSFSKHSEVYAVCGQYFSKTGAVDPKLHKMLLDAFEKRSNSDYEYMIEIPKKKQKKY